MKIGRNDRCPCGSGKKYKHCHEVKAAEKNVRSSKIALVGFAVAVLIGVGGLAMGFMEGNGSAATGRVWSAEHGHWHNADGTEVGSAPSSGGGMPAAPVPQPPGEAPPGKVWSTEHGHWHDA